jgi:hypothetical protein
MAVAGRIADLIEVNEALAERLARLEHLLARNSGNSSTVYGQAAGGSGSESGLDRHP